jgi:hypothetical protein
MNRSSATAHTLHGLALTDLAESMRRIGEGGAP